MRWFRNVGIVLVVAAALLAPAVETEATVFTPSTTVFVQNPGVGVNSSITTTFTLGYPDSMFDTLVTFIPPEFGVTPGPSVPDGSVVGSMQSDMALGLIGSACNQFLQPEWELLDGSTNTADTVSFEDADGDFTRDYFEDEDGDNLRDSVTKYPEPLTRVFPGLTPRARVTGLQPIAGVPFLANILVFEPGTQLPGLVLDPAAGYPAALVFMNFGDPEAVPEPSAISDWCAPLGLQTEIAGTTQDNPKTAANEGGYAYRTNPSSAGSYPLGTLAMSRPDADDDGYENDLDTCPLTQNFGNPKIPNSGDLDGDGLDGACDPNDNYATGGTNSDQDSDGYLNRQDNCPLVQNGQFDAMNQTDSDFDGIGDNCDIHPYEVDGHRHTACLIDVVIIGAGGPPPLLPLLPCDTDGDGVLDGADNCPTVANAAGQSDDSDGDLAGDACDGPGAGNVDCSFSVNSVDALKVLRSNAGLTVAQSEPCLDLGLERELAPPDDWKVGDVDCSGGVNAVDALKILRVVANLSVAKPPGCPPLIGPPEPAPTVQVGLRADGDDADSDFEDPEVTGDGSQVVYRLVIDNDGAFPVTITELLGDVDAPTCEDAGGDPAIGHTLDADDGDAELVTEKGADALVCTFEKSISGPAGLNIVTLVTVVAQGAGPPGGDSDITLVIIG